MSQILYDDFYKRFGIKSPQHLMAPVLPRIAKFEFPKNSLFHYVVYDSVSNGPPSDEYYFRNISKKIFVQHVLELSDSKGLPKKLSVPILPYIREYHTRNKRFRQSEDLSSLLDENTLGVINYGFAAKSYRYTRSFFTEYFKWWNIEKTVWSTIGKLAATSDRQQFIFTKLPKNLPSVSRLNASATNVNQQVLRVFNNPESLFLLEFWKWISEDFRKDSAFGTLSIDALRKINIVFQESGKFLLLNLGTLEDWRFVVSEPKEGQRIKITPADMQKRILRMMMVLMETRSVPVVDQPEEEHTEILDDEAIPLTHMDEHNDVEIIASDEGEIVDELSKASKADEILSQLDDDLEQLEKLDQERTLDEVLTVDSETAKEVKIISHASKQIDFEFFNNGQTPEEALVSLCDDLADDGVLSAPEYRRYTKQASEYKNLIAGDGKTPLGDFVNIGIDEVLIKSSKQMVDRPTILDKSMLKSSLLDFDERYITEILSRDVASMVTESQKAGFMITKYEVEKIEDILGSYEMHSVRINPIEGTPSTIRFKLPSVDEDGVFKSNGTKYRMRKQRGELPIRKVGPDVVSLTSYYGKTSVTRSDKKVNDYGNWVRNQITLKAIDQTDSSIINLSPANVFDNELNLPRAYSILATGFKSFTSNGFDFVFDYKERVKVFSPEEIAKYELNGSVLIGFSANSEVIVMDNTGAIYKGSNNNLTPLGTIENFIGLSTMEAPVDFAQVKIYGKNIPVGIVLGFKYGLDSLIDALKATVRRVPAGQRLNLQEHEYSIAFSDETLIFSKDDTLATMVFAGFREYHKVLKNFSVYTFDKPNVYLNVLESNGISARYLREIDLMDKLFVDPITKQLLEEMKEPTTFRGLLIRGTEMLLTDKHPDAFDMSQMRIKGYERLAGAVYAEIINSVREHKGRSGRSNHPIEFNPNVVWRRIAQDPSISLVSDINPIENLKQQEAVTYSGVGGRIGRSMTKKSRSYHENDMGVISEATSDSSDVAINTYTSADPQFNSLRGTTKRYVIGKSGATPLLSTSAMMSVASNHDDPKRVNFASIQHGHGLACTGYRQSAVRTGYEQVLAQRTSDLFAYAAREDGVVLSKNEKGIVIQYKSGKKKSVELGRRYGSAAGLTIAHSVISELKAGDTFKTGDIISYNDGFFERDILNPNNVIWKMGVTVKTALYESTQTHEDASSISKRLASQLTTKTTKLKTVVVTFDQEVKNVLGAGNSVEHETILCVIEDAITSNSGLFDEQTLNTLRVLSNQTPTAKVRGVLERIEVYYNGEKEDMSGSLRKLADASDRELAARSRSLQSTAFTGSVNEDFRIDGEPLGLDSVAIKFFITSDVPAGIGD